MTPKGVFSDVLILAGYGLVVYGTWRVYEPAGFIVAGVLMLMAGVGSSLGGGGRR